jgi:hypothetical protein
MDFMFAWWVSMDIMYGLQMIYGFICAMKMFCELWVRFMSGHWMDLWLIAGCFVDCIVDFCVPQGYLIDFYVLQRCFVDCMLWGDFLSLYSQFYEVIILKGTYVIGEGKMQSVFLDIKLRL